MNARIRGLLLGAVAVAVAAVSTNAVQPPVARAQSSPPMMTDGTPTQAWTDLSSAESGNGATQAGWGDMDGGVAARPYVSSLTVINGAVQTPVITGGSTVPPSSPMGGVTAVVSPFNLCKAGQPETQGSCYSSPNRVGLTVAYNAGDTYGVNFAAPRVPVTPTVNANTVIDMTVALNTLGKSLRWTSMNGDLLYWQTSNLGQDNATVRVKFRPAPSPWVTSFSGSNGCTATPIRDCDIPRADDEFLTAAMVFSLDDSLDPALTGAAFATQNAVSGYLEPGGTAQAPSLDVQVASTHTKADGTPQLGTLKAFIPAAALLNLYGLLPGDAAAFTTTRAGDRGTNDAPTYTPWSAAANGSDGVLVTVEDITFSVPKYRVSSKLRPIRTKARARGAKTTITSTIAGCSKRKRCLATVYDLGPLRRARYVAKKTTVLRNKTVDSRALSLTGSASRLKRADRYLLLVRSVRGKRLLASGVGTVR
jgi:hypothetical protein